MCNSECVKAFSELPYERKFCFVTKDYGYDSDVLWSEPCELRNIPNDTILFRENIDLIKFINGSNDYKKRRKKAFKKLSVL